MVKLHSKQRDIRIKKASKGIDLEFKDEPIEVSEEVADYLLKTRADLFYVEEAARKGGKR